MLACQGISPAGLALHSGLSVPPTASQAFVLGEASGDMTGCPSRQSVTTETKPLPSLFHLTIK